MRRCPRPTSVLACTLLLTATVLAGAPVPAASAVASVPCSAYAAQGRDLSFVTADATGACAATQVSPDVFPVAPRTVRLIDLDATAGYRTWTLWATHSGSLHRVSVRRDLASVPVDTVTSTGFGNGWDGIRLLLAGGTRHLYGLHDNGRLYRYRLAVVGGQQTVVSAGSVAGFDGVRGMDILRLGQDRTEFLATTSAGTLTLVRVPTTTAMTATSSPIRTRTWQGTDQLVVQPAYGAPTSGLAAINRTSGRWTTYEVGNTARGTATPVSVLGSQPIAADLTRAVSGLVYPYAGKP